MVSKMHIESFCNKFCKPFDIYHFIYIEIFYSGKVDIISSHRPFLDIYLDKKFPFSSELSEMITASANKDLLFLWPNNATEDLPKILDELLICNGITMVEKTDVSLCTYAFATDQFHCGFANFFINNLDTLRKIKRQFLLEYCSDSCEEKGTFFSSPLLKPSKIKLNKKNVHFDSFISVKNKIVPISDQKMRILQKLSEGKSSKEVAEFLNISARTVDKQIELLMNHSGIHSRKLLIKAYQNGI